MIKTTKWKLGTCECIVEYTWDTDVDEKIRIHTLKEFIEKCDAHSNTDNEVLFNSFINKNG